MGLTPAASTPSATVRYGEAWAVVSRGARSEEHTSELQSHKLISYAVFCLFFNDTATTEIYTLSLHDALPISRSLLAGFLQPRVATTVNDVNAGIIAKERGINFGDRKSTRLNSSHTS